MLQPSYYLDFGRTNETFTLPSSSIPTLAIPILTTRSMTHWVTSSERE
jgi:hypothetical protein